MNDQEQGKSPEELIAALERVYDALGVVKTLNDDDVMRYGPDVIVKAEQLLEEFLGLLDL